MARRDARALDHKTLEEMRIRAVEAVQSGQRVEVVAEAMGLSRSTVFGWMARYRVGGWDALMKAKPVSGRPAKITASQMEWIYRTIASKTPQQYRFEFALWTLDLVRWLIGERFGIRLSKTSTWRLMKQMGLSAQRPLWRALEQDAEAVERWKREQYPRIQELAKAEKASIWFADEAGVRSDYHRGTTWAPVGQTPVVRTTGARYRWNRISAVSARGDMRFMLTAKSVTAKVFVEFLRRLITGTQRPVYLIVDGHPSHRSSLVRQFLRNNEGRHPPVLPAAVLGGIEPGRAGLAGGQVTRRRPKDGGQQAGAEAAPAAGHAPVAACAPQDQSFLPNARNRVRHGGVNLLTCGTVSMPKSPADYTSKT